MVAREMLIIGVPSLVVGWGIRFVCERKTLVIRSAFLRPGYVIIGILAAVPIANTQALIRVWNQLVQPLHIPGLEVEPGIEKPHIDSDRIRVDPLPNFDCLHVLTLRLLIPPHASALKLIG